MESETTTDLWETIVPILRDQLTESVWFSTFNDAVNVGSTGSILLEVSNHVAGERIMSRYRSMIDDALAEVG
ncbi:MAG: DnaA N-terminal domain-containing protein, partial [Ilumatobacteraceae bacterium]